MQEPYVEAIALLSPKADAAAVGSWFVEHGLSVSLMAGGNLQIAGYCDRFTQVFQMTEAQLAARRARDVEVPIPVDLRESVQSIVVRRLPSLHD